MDDQRDPAPLGETQDATSTIDQEASSSKQPTAGDSSADMAPGGRPRPNTPKRDVDLSSLLTVPEKTELVLFAGKVTDSMQKQIIQVFDSTGVNDQTATRISFWARLPAHLRDFTLGPPKRRPEPRPAAIDKENIRPGISQSTATSSHDNANSDPDPFAPEVEQTGPRLQELKKEVLLHFKKWQMAIQKRVSDISIKRTTDPQGGQSSYGSVRRNNRNRQREAKASTLEPDPHLLQMYPPIATSLVSLPADKRALILHTMLLLVLSLEHYSAYSRVFLLHIASSLHLPLRILAEDEVRIAKSLADTTKNISFEEILQKKAEENKPSKKWKVAMASAAGAALLGVTGGLAAPLVAAGIGSILGGIGLGSTAAAGLLGTMAESGLIVGSLFGIYGARASGKMMDQYAKDVQDFAFIPLYGSTGEDSEIGKVLPENRRLRVVLTLSGWLTNEGDVHAPWRVLGQQSEVYAVRWELEPLMKMGNALETVIKSAAWSMAKKEIIARTIFASLSQALWPVGLLKISKIIDNPWNVAMVRADKTGAVLADIILNKTHGERGVTLIGYSLGARVIYVCLMILAERRVFGLVENVVLMGTPAPSDPQVWCAMRSVVSGRLVNVYSANDYILGFLYRTSSIQFGVAGLQRIEGIDGVENVDVSAKVSGHLRYQYLVGSILKHIGWEDVDLEQVAQNEAVLTAMERRNREREQKRDAVIELEVEAKNMEQEVKEKNEKNQQGIIRTRARKMKSKK
ncbi:DUF726-domain-containing protein [Echria macrotheca]|uniref:DUF726-domain-containing protein n=1 Tax=Echria macrotheca TaxID=438768 RepID=A0AAJ0BA72_9PEZI|nr:DUF726-domain-containing protein [Echria macrotheca]